MNSQRTPTSKREAAFHMATVTTLTDGNGKDWYHCQGWQQGPVNRHPSNIWMPYGASVAKRTPCPLLPLPRRSICCWGNLLLCKFAASFRTHLLAKLRSINLKNVFKEITLRLILFGCVALMFLKHRIKYAVNSCLFIYLNWCALI